MNVDRSAPWLSVVLLIPILSVACARRTSPPASATQAPLTRPNGPDSAATQPDDDPELRDLFDADQADRRNKKIDGREVVRRDAEREARVRALIEAGVPKTGRDYYHAAMVFQHAPSIEGVELAHELAMIGLSLGDRGSRWLAAASYDRLLARLGRGQRFGTQYGPGGAFEPHRLMPIEPGVTDAMRLALRCPVLDKDEQREAEQAAGSRSTSR